MKNYYKFLFILLLALANNSISAQKSITVAFDPLTTVALGGYEIEAGLNLNKNRITASFLSGDLSPWFGDVTEYNSTNHDVFEVAWSRFVNDDHSGLNYGIAYAYYIDFTIEDTQGQRLTKHPSKVSLKLAYAWFPFNSIPLYLEPSMTFGFMIDDEELNFTSGQTFNKKSFIGNGPLFNIGYKFIF